MDIIRICEAGGFDTIFVESVGIGQSEIDIARAVDVVVFVISPGSGDDIQAMKKVQTTQ
jgi:LAO/AO transport system kinase